MQFLLARQPIFDRNLKVFSYELLYRNSEVNAAIVTDGEKATSSVLVNALLSGDFDVLTGEGAVFINFTDQLIIDEIPHILDPNKIIIEVLEDAFISDALVEAVIKLKEMGFRIALDDFTNSYIQERLIPYIDFLKVDMMRATSADLMEIIKRYKSRGIKLLAEKVETAEVFQEVLTLGFDYFQGYFFAKPVVLKGKDVKGFNATLMRIVDAMQKPDPDFKKIAQIIECDIALTYKLLRVVNSAAYYRRSKVHSVQQALTLLGIKELRKWIYLFVLREQSTDKPSELLKVSLIRAKFSEALSKELGFGKEAADAFMAGLLSLLDAMMDRELVDLIKELPLDENIKTALLGQENGLQHVLQVVMSYEQAQWEPFYEHVKLLNLDPLIVPSLYFDSLSWAGEMVESISE